MTDSQQKKSFDDYRIIADKVSEDATRPLARSGIVDPTCFSRVLDREDSVMVEGLPIIVDYATAYGASIPSNNCLTSIPFDLSMIESAGFYDFLRQYSTGHGHVIDLMLAQVVKTESSEIRDKRFWRGLGQLLTESSYGRVNDLKGNVTIPFEILDENGRYPGYPVYYYSTTLRIPEQTFASDTVEFHNSIENPEYFDGIGDMLGRFLFEALETHGKNAAHDLTDGLDLGLDTEYYSLIENGILFVLEKDGQPISVMVTDCHQRNVPYYMDGLTNPDERLVVVRDVATSAKARGLSAAETLMRKSLEFLTRHDYFREQGKVRLLFDTATETKNVIPYLLGSAALATNFLPIEVRADTLLQVESFKES